MTARKTIRSITHRAPLWNGKDELDSPARYVDVSAVSRDDLAVQSVATLPVDQLPSRARKFVRAGDTLFATVRPGLRRVAMVPPELEGALASTAFCVLRPDPDQVDPSYLYFATASEAFVERVADLQTGASYPAVRDRDVLDQEIDLPDPSEQRTVGNVLNFIWNSVRREGRLITAAESLKRAAMRELFTRGLRGDPLRESEAGTTPAGWRIDRLVDFAHFQRGFDITKSDQTAGPIPVVSSGGIRSSHNVAAATGPGVIIGRKGSIGTLHFVETDYWPHDTALWCTDFKGNLPKFVYYRLQLLDFKRLDSGAANPALNRNSLHELLLTWPDVDEQRDVVEILDAIDQKVDLHGRKKAVLEELFKALLHKLMAGEIRVADLDLAALPAGAER